MKEKGHYMMKKVSIQQEDIIFVNIYASNIEVVSLVAQMVKKRLYSMQETQVLSLGQEDPLEKEMESHSSILARKIP